MKLRPALVGLAGAGLLVLLVWRAGWRPVARAAAALGLPAFGLLLVSQLALALIAAAAWATLARGRSQAPLRAFAWARLVRDAAGQALPFTQIGGIALGARALALEGAGAGVAVASTLADTALEFLSELAYAALGAALLQALRPHQPIGAPVLAMLAGLAVMAALFLYAQGAGVGWVERLLRRRGAGDGDGALPISEMLADIRRRPLRAAAAGLIHAVAWVLTGVQTWLVLRGLHAATGLAGAIVLDSLTSGARAAAFLVPAGLGVQEGALVLLGQLFGVSPAAALALSLIRRGRDLALAAPVLAAWQLRHGERIWRLGDAVRRT